MYAKVGDSCIPIDTPRVRVGGNVTCHLRTIIIERSPRAPQSIARRIEFLLSSDRGLGYTTGIYGIMQALSQAHLRPRQYSRRHGLTNSFMSPNRTTSVELASKEAQRVRVHNGYFHEYTSALAMTHLAAGCCTRRAFAAARHSTSLTSPQGHLSGVSGLPHPLMVISDSPGVRESSAAPLSSSRKAVNFVPGRLYFPGLSK